MPTNQCITMYYIIGHLNCKLASLRPMNLIILKILLLTLLSNYYYSIIIMKTNIILRFKIQSYIISSNECLYFTYLKKCLCWFLILVIYD